MVSRGHLWWTCGPSSFFQGPAYLPAGPPHSYPESVADGRIHSPHGSCQNLPVSRRSDGLSHVAFPGSDSHWTLQGQGWLNRNHGGNCLLSWLLWPFLFQHPFRRSSLWPKSRKGDRLCLLAARYLGGSVRRHQSLMMKPTPSSSWCLACTELIIAFYHNVPFCLAENSFFTKLNIKSLLMTDSKRVVRVDVRVTSGLQDYNPPVWSITLCERVHEGQTQAVLSFCTFLVATCVFSSLLLDNVKMDINTLFTWVFPRPVWPSARKGLPMPVLCFVTRQARVTSPSMPFSYFILRAGRLFSPLNIDLMSPFFCFYFWESLEVAFSLTTHWSLRPSLHTC